MPITLYDSTVGSFLQTLGAVEGFLAKGLAHCKEKNVDPNEIVEARLFADMLPFRFQVVAVAHHSAGAIAGAKAGAFAPPGPSTADYAGLQKLVSDAKQSLGAVKPEEVNALEGKDVLFSVRDMKLPFKAEGFLMTFSMPNFHFHATTAYDILRSKGVPIGKRDYMGKMKLAN
ncbi:MAG: DUF1993 domain-containing protein [Alphaproteobacteria bacterium]|nr:MAG: DUF1993 domain-containing protein [Alphaproteobacteria bacterium]